MIKLSNIIEGINAVNSMEEPSFHPQETSKIDKFVDQIEKKRPDGIRADEVFANTPNLNTAQRLKLLIALAQRRLLTFGGIKLNPSSVMKIYANDQRKIAKDTIEDPVNFNEIKNISSELPKLWNQFKEEFSNWVKKHTHHTMEQLGWVSEKKALDSSKTPGEFLTKEVESDEVLEGIYGVWEEWQKNPNQDIGKIAIKYFPDED